MRIEPAHGVVEVGNILLAPALQRTRAATEAMYLMARMSSTIWVTGATNGSATRATNRAGGPRCAWAFPSKEYFASIW